MVDASKRELILGVVKRRLQRITRFNGFETDAGKTVFLGFAPAMGPDDPTAAIAIRVGDDEPGKQQERVAITLPIEIQALADSSRETDPWMKVEEVLADVKRAFELTQELEAEQLLETELRFVRETATGRYASLLNGFIDRGQTLTLERPDGSTVIGTAVIYRLPYSEAWGVP